MLALSNAGIEQSGRLHLPYEGIRDEEVSLEIYHRCNRVCILSNDCNQVAYGSAPWKRTYKNLIYNFRLHLGGCGNKRISSRTPEKYFPISPMRNSSVTSFRST